MRCSVIVDMIFQMLFRSMIGCRFAGGPGGFLGLGSAMRVPWPRALIGWWCSKAEFMIGAIAGDIALLPYLKSSLLIPSGPDERPFLKVLMALLTSSSFIGTSNGLGSPRNGSSCSPPGSVNCFLNHSLIVSAFPLSVATKWPSALCTESDGIELPVFRARAALNILRHSSVEEMSFARESALIISSSLRRLLILRRMLLGSVLRLFRSSLWPCW